MFRCIKASLASLAVLTAFACVGPGQARVLWQRNLVQPANSYDRCFDVALQTMAQDGQVIAHDRKAGFISGKSGGGANLSVALVKTATGQVEINVRATVPPGMVGYGNFGNADSFLEAYRKRLDTTASSG